MPSRLYRSIIAFGVTLGTASSASTIVTACDGADEHAPPVPDGWYGIIDAALPCVDAGCPDAWFTPIADAPTWAIDAGPADAAPPDAPAGAARGAS